MGKAFPYPAMNWIGALPASAVGRRSVALGPERPPRGFLLLPSGFMAPPYAGGSFSRSQPRLS